MQALQSKAPGKAPDFRRIDTWIFDLDNTLYPAQCDLFSQIDARMTAYVGRLLGVDAEEARRLQKEHYRLHGTTLNGLMKVHGIEPEHYLADVHDVDLSAVEAAPDLARAIARLPGERFIFTNGCRNYAARVLERVGLSALFKDIWDIRSIGFRPKPDAQAYRAMVKAADVNPRHAAMFDDIARNLVPAQELGMTTVWLNNGSEWSRQGPESPRVEPHHIRYETDDLTAFLQSIRI
jgi:putative hydrolase of the HAD superfamily